ncbi:MAG: Hsp20/alpha crystallin family protein [Planctomycetes bacterium]|nr:Hsp20/alpha crystallin family protein [Planctomycetota bacterium]
MQKTLTRNPQSPIARDPFQSLFHRLFQDMWSELPTATESNQAPLANISETEQAYHLAFELPGLEEKDIDVHVEDNTLTITAERRDERAAEGDRKWHRVEHRYGRFMRAISLPRDAKSDDIDAVYKHGILTVTVPKAPEAQKKRVTVRGN